MQMLMKKKLPRLYVNSKYFIRENDRSNGNVMDCRCCNSISKH